MHLQEWLILVLKSTVFQQIAPLIILFLIPALVFFASRHLRRLSLHALVFGWLQILSMGLESLGFSLPWLWSGSSSQTAISSNGSRGKKHKRKSSGSSSKSKGVRTRTEQIAMDSLAKSKGTDKFADDSELEDYQYYPGLVNISGTYCFMNSTLQAMASLSYLQPHIDAIHSKAVALDVPTPVIDALQELFKNLNTPKSTYNSLRPHGIISALSNPQPPTPNSKGTFHPSTSSSLFNSREHQDAQELFQLVSECIKNEMGAVDREGLRDRGIAGVLDLEKPPAVAPREKSDLMNEDGSVMPRSMNSKSVFDGLTANRRSCVVCGYTEAVMHFGFDNWQLAVPRLATSCRLEDCLEDYTRLEILKDCICRKCSVLATHRRLLQELKILEDAIAPPSAAASTSASTVFSSTSPAASSSSMPSSSPSKSKPSNSKKKRYKEVKRMEQRVKTALAEGRIEDESLLEGVRLERVVSPASTKQAMIARPPPVLALHLNRSVHYGQYATKNNIKVYFPEVLDLTPYTTSGSLSTIPTNSISTPSPPPTTSQPVLIQSSGSSTISSAASATSSQPRRSTTPTPETYAPGAQRTIYRLAAVVCHYGQHSFGHYICYRRKPRRIGGKWVPPTLVDPLRMEMDEEEDGQDGAEKKPNGSVVKSANYFGSSTYGESRYYWEDGTEEEAGTGRGWLRISDDSVSECGIESVLAEGSGAFMLYYERAVHPRPGVYMRGRGNGKAKEADSGVEGDKAARSRSRSRSARVDARDVDGDSIADTDADAFSVGSEETLKPEMKVVNLNGSIGSLISEVGVGVMKVHKKDKDKAKVERGKSKDGRGAHLMTMSTLLPLSSASSSSSSTGFGPRIVRSVNARRRNTPEASTATAKGVISPSPSESASLSSSSTNGTAIHSHDNEGVQDPEDNNVPSEMTASAPSILLGSNIANSASSGQTTAHAHTGLGIGSKTTKIVHHPPPSASGVKVNAR
ncbi:hypothetical protein BDZ97DRAFT_1916718 [Flammula alnicola]|nr:hypothetical protein BDZ97DRAFT_1916718 [Flammula alnicola]